MIDLAGIGNLLEYLVAADNITCEERDRIILRIAKENDIAEYTLSALAGYGKSKSEVLESVARRKNSVSQDKKQDESYISLTEIARAHSEDAPGYVIQSWLRSGNTLAFLNLWEQENNPDYSEAGYEELLEKKKAASFTLTLKLWIDRTKAIGIVSKQGKAGGTFAHPMIACEFASWIAPEFENFGLIKKTCISIYIDKREQLPSSFVLHQYLKVSTEENIFSSGAALVQGLMKVHGKSISQKDFRDRITDNVIIDNDYVTVIVTGYEDDEIWGYTANLFLLNKTDKTVMFSVDDASVNGFMADPFYATSVSAGKCAFSSMAWSDTTLEENGITEVEEIEVLFRAYDADDFMGEDFANEVITLNP